MTTQPNAMIWTGTDRGYVRFDALTPLEKELLIIFGDTSFFDGSIPLTLPQAVLTGRGYTPVRRTGSLCDVAMISPVGINVTVDSLGCVRCAR